MTSGILALIAGGLIGLGAATALLALAPTHPDLREYLAQTGRTSRRATTPAPAMDVHDRLGRWLMLHLPVTRLVAPPAKDLALLRRPVHRFYADKVLFGLVGVIFPTIAAAMLALSGVRVPFVISLGAALMAGVAMSFLPDYTVRDEAKAARAEFRHALSSYVELVAIARNSGAQTRQALEIAARTGDSWVFARLREELVNSRFAGHTPWDAFRDMADELSITDLADLADIMRSSAEDSASVYKTLRARATSMRGSLQTADIAKANAVNERLVMPAALLFIVFTMALAAPVLLRAMGVLP